MQTCVVFPCHFLQDSLRTTALLRDRRFDASGHFRVTVLTHLPCPRRRLHQYRSSPTHLHLGRIAPVKGMGRVTNRDVPTVLRLAKS